MLESDSVPSSAQFRLSLPSLQLYNSSMSDGNGSQWDQTESIFKHFDKLFFECR